MITIILENLPKISLNKFYSGVHWTKRNKIKDEFKWVVRSQTKAYFLKDKQYEVEYHFEFKTKPLDCSNASGGLVKMLEDILFEDDAWNVVTKLTVTSTKSTKDRVTILITEI